MITGENAKHIRVLRMKNGEELTLVTPNGIQHDCAVADVNQNGVEVDVKESYPCRNEPDVFVTLYQALPKGDKMDYIVQKCVELGVSRIVPVLTDRCVSRPDEKSLRKKRERWQKIALQAAMQSRRGMIPEVTDCLSLRQAAEETKQNDSTVFFYELGGASVKDILREKPKTIGMFIGSEGGFTEDEASLMQASGAHTATLGKRILRAETAPLAALSIIMYQTDNFS
jgi:16S rRNA (uracil1498-N3)-methyltransferase